MLLRLMQMETATSPVSSLGLGLLPERLMASLTPKRFSLRGTIPLAPFNGLILQEHLVAHLIMGRVFASTDQEIAILRGNSGAN
jgi:hypothetical protein